MCTISFFDYEVIIRISLYQMFTEG